MTKSSYVVMPRHLNAGSPGFFEWRSPAGFSSAGKRAGRARGAVTVRIGMFLFLIVVVEVVAKLAIVSCCLIAVGTVGRGFLPVALLAALRTSSTRRTCANDGAGC